jgi:prevent-host-death family protein
LGITAVQSEISKSEFKAKALEILRAVESTGEPVLVTDRGVPTVEVRPYRAKVRDVKALLRGSVLSFEKALEPTGTQWEAME